MMVALSEIFDVEYGNQLDFNKMTPCVSGVNFVTRSRRNLGIGERVSLVPNCKLYAAGDITVTLGGTYLLSAFVQPAPFYTGQNIKVLRPKEEMSFGEKVFYCECISKNRFRYSSHGREANRSLDSLLVPSREDVPSWAKTQKAGTPLIKPSTLVGDLKNFLNTDELVPLRELFETKRGINVAGFNREPIRLDDTYLPIIRPSRTQISSFVEYVSSNEVPAKNIFPQGTLYVSTNGQGSHTFAYVSAFDFVPNSDVTVLFDRSGKMSLGEKIYYSAAISMNRRLFSYGRKPKGERLESILLPKSPPSFVFDDKLAKKVVDQQ